MNGIPKRLWGIVAIVLLLIASTVQAQGMVTYGSGATGSINATAPLAFYSFSGAVDDIITVQVLAITPGFNPSIALNAPNQQQLAFNSGDPFNPGVARISYRLTQAGTYTLLVSSNDGNPGDFALRLDGAAAPETSAVSEDGTAATNIDADAPVAVYAVAGNPDAAQTVTLSTTTGGFAFAALLRDAQGQTLAIVNGSSDQPAALIVPASAMTYEVEVRPASVGTTGDVNIAVATIGEAPQETTEAAAEETAPPPETTEAAAEQTAPPPETTEETVAAECSATRTEGGSVNARSGPGTAYDVIGSMPANTPLAVLGVNSASGWYVLRLVDGTEAWVRGDLFQLSGDCTTVPEADAPALNADVQPTDAPAGPTATLAEQPVQATATATATVVQEQAQPTAVSTATFTPSYTPTTQPAAQLAPEDARFNNPLNIPLDNTTSVLDFVSYPGGDREDRVRFDVTGMNQNSSLSGGRARLVIAVSCFGQNTDQVQFFTGGQTYSCGQTLVDREVTANSDTGSIVITAIGGEGTYVQWVLTGTATRVN